MDRWLNCDDLVKLCRSVEITMTEVTEPDQPTQLYIWFADLGYSIYVGISAGKHADRSRIGNERR